MQLYNCSVPAEQILSDSDCPDIKDWRDKHRVRLVLLRLIWSQASVWSGLWLTI